jgi:hypothetical protein
MNRPCEGYCGGRFTIGEGRTTQDGDRFCRDCYQKWRAAQFSDE